MPASLCIISANSAIRQVTTTSISLLERLRQPGQERAWDRFVELYAPLVYDWACGIGLSADDAEDLVQDVMTVMLTKLPEFEYDNTKSFRGWLRTITTNRCRDFFRRRGKMPQLTRQGALEVDAPDASDLFAEEEYRQRLVSRALDLMQTEFESSTWRACWESVVNERAAAEVASELGITVNAVYVAKSRVLRRLRQELARLLD
jgi:RNA polymerase sigma-70 factor (ECF subfamily)